MRLALVIPFRGATPGTNPKFLQDLARLLARLTHFDDPDDRPDLVVIGHDAANIGDQPRLEKKLPGEIRRHPCGRAEMPIEFAVRIELLSRWKPSVPRNLGAARALALGADALVFMDADCLPAPGSFREAREALATGALMVHRPWLVGEQLARALVVDALWANLPRRKIEEEEGFEHFFMPGAWTALSADLFRTVGGYDTSLSRGEDEDIVHRARRTGAECRIYDRLCVHVGKITNPKDDPNLPAITAELQRRERLGIIRPDQAGAAAP